MSAQPSRRTPPFRPTRLRAALLLLWLGPLAGTPGTSLALTELPDDWAPLPGLAIAQGSLFFDRQTNRFLLPVQVQNTAAEPLTAPLRLVIDSPLAVINASGTTAAGLPYIDLPPTAPGLAPGMTTVPVEVALQRAGRTPPQISLAVEADIRPFPLQLLHVADIDSTSATAALENVKGFSALLDHFRADPQFGPYSLTLSSGDNWIPGPRYNAAADARLVPLLGLPAPGRGDVGMLNAMGFEASAVGNHELDQGPGAFANIIAPMTTANGDWPGAAFPYLAVNLDFGTDLATAGLVIADGEPVTAGAGRLAGWSTAEVAGQTIGIVGAVTPTLPRITSPGNIGVFPADPDDLAALAAEIQHGVDALIASGVNKVILLAHMQQIAVEIALAERLRGVDIIVAGGSNTRLLDEDDVLFPGDTVQGPYPILTAGADGVPTLIVNTDGDYKYLGRLVAEFDPRGRLDLASLEPARNGAWATHAERLADLGLSAADAAPDLAALADTLLEVVLELRANAAGLTQVYLDGERGAVRTQETNLGNLTADANLWLAQQYDDRVQVSLKNGGGIRAAIGQVVFPPGSTDPADAERLPPPDHLITQLDIESSLAFNNGLTLLTLTAAELHAVIEHGVAASGPGASPGQFPQVAGLRFGFDPGLAPGQRVRSMALVDDSGAVIDVLVADGALVGDPERPVRIVTLDFLANGGDGYPFPPTERVDLVDPNAPRTGRFDFAADGSEQDALAEYLGGFFAEVRFDLAESPPLADRRIQNLAVAGIADSVFEFPPAAVRLVKIGGIALAGAEIVSWDPDSQRLFIAGEPDAEGQTLRIVDLADPTDPVLIAALDPAADVAAELGGFQANDVTSVAVKNGLAVVGVVARPKRDPGRAAFYDTDGNFLGSLATGSLPDMVAWDHAGDRVLIANEGEPDGAFDPPGSVTVIDVPRTGTPAARLAGATVNQVGFVQFDGFEDDLRLDGVRIFPGKRASEDFEPEYIAFSLDDDLAYVALQENNSLAIVDLTATPYAIAPTLIPLGTKDHDRLYNAIDASDRDGPGGSGAINIQPWPVRGMYMPDGIDTYDPGLGRTFVLTANEGDVREEPDNEDRRIGHASIVLDPTVFPDAAELKQQANLGRLDMSTIDGRNAAGQYEALFVYGARSFSIWDLEQGTLADSNDDVERVTAWQTPELFNANRDGPATFDTRSDNKGAEPETVITGQIDGRWYAFLGLERAGGGVMVYDVTNPHLPRFQSYTPGFPTGDISVEGMAFIAAAESPNGRPLVITANEGSGTIAVYAAVSDAEPTIEAAVQP